MKRLRIAFTLAGLLAAGVLAQTPQLAPAVREFVKVDAPWVALQHVRVIDGTGAAPREDQTVVIANGTIKRLGNAANTAIPDGAKLLDLTGYTVIPGLVGMHNHMYYPAPGGQPVIYPEHAASFPRLYLAGGVTTIRTTGSIETYTDLAIKRAIDEGRMIGPKVHVTGPYLEGAGAAIFQLQSVLQSRQQASAAQIAAARLLAG